MKNLMIAIELILLLKFGGKKRRRRKVELEMASTETQ
jgi:hypothetical protein